MKLKAIINPMSGHREGRRIIKDVVSRLKKQYSINDSDIIYINFNNTQTDNSFLESCDAIIVAGGDGTLHYAVNAIKHLGIDKPVAYFPTGTVNDFGNCLNLPRTPDKFCEMLKTAETKKIDLGLIGDIYFHYVVAGGAISSVSYTTKQYFKNTIGKAAYYLNALLHPSKLMKSTYITIDSDELHDKQEVLLYLVTNSSIIGGFKGIVPDAKMDDGHLHVLVIKKTSFLNTMQLFTDIQNGTHIKRPDVLYFKTKRLNITHHNIDDSQIGIDGEMCGYSCKGIKIVPQGLTLIIPSKVNI